ncbi:hypothetical protein ADUPG1_012341 [Aduncisulcus paluster]|uniref:Uncharacterized protein n=1 Tax=Aduncisulcus paluster TaxID=2918883 RepID=A0ABQ5JZ50_9EUKA|nr:hypothetical protein ADUPG1_012341 [Aduncisulcus paluster]
MVPTVASLMHRPLPSPHRSRRVDIDNTHLCDLSSLVRPGTMKSVPFLRYQKIGLVLFSTACVNNIGKRVIEHIDNTHLCDLSSLVRPGTMKSVPFLRYQKIGLVLFSTACVNNIGKRVIEPLSQDERFEIERTSFSPGCEIAKPSSSTTSGSNISGYLDLEWGVLKWSSSSSFKE